MQGAPVEAGRRVERLGIDVDLHDRLDDILKKTLLNLRRLEQDTGVWPKTTSKTSWNDSQKCSLFLILRRRHTGDDVDEQVER